MNAAEHADFEALSAYVDGEAPEWADHVEGCPRCRATAAELRALSSTVAAPVAAPPPAQREAAIAAALGAGAQRLAPDDGGHRLAAPGVTTAREVARQEAERARFARLRWSPGSWAMPAVAAVVLALLGLSGVILSANRSTDEVGTTFAGPAFDAKAESAVPGAPGAPVGDLGDVPDAATLRARALGVTTDAGGRSAASSNAGAPADALNAASPQVSSTNTGNTGAAVSAGASTPNAVTGAPAATSAASGGAGGSLAIAPNAVGARPCEERARAREPGLGPVTYFATARRGTVPAFVLGFASGPNVTLLMLAQDGCGELLRSAGP